MLNRARLRVSLCVCWHVEFNITSMWCVFKGKDFCFGVNNEQYRCEMGYCCGETECCTYYYELWCKSLIFPPLYFNTWFCHSTSSLSLTHTYTHQKVSAVSGGIWTEIVLDLHGGKEFHPVASDSGAHSRRVLEDGKIQSHINYSARITVAPSKEVAAGSFNENVALTLPFGDKVFFLLSLSDPSNMETHSHNIVLHCNGTGLKSFPRKAVLILTKMLFSLSHNLIICLVLVDEIS